MTNTKARILISALLLAVIMAAKAYSITASGTSIESQAQLYYAGGAITSETSVTTVEQMFGITVEPVSIYGYDIPGNDHYFMHVITNLGNGTDMITFNVTNESVGPWTCVLSEDANQNQVYDPLFDTQPLSDPLPLSEGAVLSYFVRVSVPSSALIGSSQEVRLTASSEGHDGGTYIGANGIIYGGPDSAEAHDKLELGLIHNLKINREDPSGKIYISWDGGYNVDVYSISGTYDATFSLATKEAISKASPYYCASLEARDGKIRFYRVAPEGTTAFAAQTLGKFDVPVVVGVNELSDPLIRYSGRPANLIGQQVQGASSANNADRMWKFKQSTGTYDYAWCVAGVGAPYDGKWYNVNTETTMEIGTDEGFVLEIRTGHSTKPITMIGEVSTVDRIVPVAVGINFVGNCFPIRGTLEASNLWQSGMKGASSANNADRVWKYKPTLGSYDYSWLVDGVNPSVNGKWYNVNTPSTMELTPGYGYRLEVRSVHPPFTWTHKKPY